MRSAICRRRLINVTLDNLSSQPFDFGVSCCQRIFRANAAPVLQWPELTDPMKFSWCRRISWEKATLEEVSTALGTQSQAAV